MTLVDPKHQDPLRQLAGNLHIQWRPGVRWWGLKAFLLGAPLVVATVGGLFFLDGAWQALVFTFVGAAASIEAAGPYTRLVNAVQSFFEEMRESDYSMWFGIKTSVRYLWDCELHTNRGPVGPRKVYMPILRWRYRGRYRQIHRYFHVLEGRTLFPGENVPELVIFHRNKKGCMLQFARKKLQERALQRLGRDLIRSTGNCSEDVAVAYIAEENVLAYSKPHTAKKRSRRYEADLPSFKW